VAHHHQAMHRPHQPEELRGQRRRQQAQGGAVPFMPGPSPGHWTTLGCRPICPTPLPPPPGYRPLLQDFIVPGANWPRTRQKILKALYCLSG